MTTKKLHELYLTNDFLKGETYGQWFRRVCKITNPTLIQAQMVAGVFPLIDLGNLAKLVVERTK